MFYILSRIVRRFLLCHFKLWVPQGGKLCEYLSASVHT